PRDGHPSPRDSERAPVRKRVVRPPRKYVRMGLAPAPPPRPFLRAGLSLGIAAMVATGGVSAWRAIGKTADVGFRRPSAVDASQFATRWPIKHVVFIVKENRSFDHMFGQFPGADGA